MGLEPTRRIRHKILSLACLPIPALPRTNIYYRISVHLSKDIETALNVGKRHGKPVVLKIASGKMYQDRQAFYLSANGVWLTKKVDIKYIEQINV